MNETIDSILKFFNIKKSNKIEDFVNCNQKYRGNRRRIRRCKERERSASDAGLSLRDYKNLRRDAKALGIKGKDLDTYQLYAQQQQAQQDLLTSVQNYLADKDKVQADVGMVRLDDARKEYEISYNNLLKLQNDTSNFDESIKETQNTQEKTGISLDNSKKFLNKIKNIIGDKNLVVIPPESADGVIAEEILSDTIREKINRITDLETINKLNLQIERENLAKIEADLKNQEITGEDINSETKYAEEKYKRIMEIQKKLLYIQKRLYILNSKRKIDRDRELKLLYSVLDKFNNNEDRVRDIQRYNEINDKKINMIKEKELNQCASTEVLNVKLADQIKKLEAELKSLEEKQSKVDNKLSKTRKKMDGQSDIVRAVGLTIITIFGILVFAVLLTYHKSSLNRLEKLYGPRIPSSAASIGPPKFETNVDIKASK